MSLSLLPFFPQTNGTVLTVRQFGNTIYIAGSFTTVGGQARAGFAAIDATTGAVLPLTITYSGGFAQILDIAEYLGYIYISGSFTTVNGNARVNAAKLSTAGTVQSWDPDPAGGTPTIYRIRGFNGNIYLAGGFTSLKASTVPVARSGMAVVDTTNGDPTAWNPDVTGIVRDFDINPATGALYLTGDITAIAGSGRTNLGAVDVYSGGLLSWAPTVYSGGIGTEVLVNGDTIYVAGSFFLSSGTNGIFTRINLVAFDAFGSVLPFNALIASSFPPNVASLALSQDGSRLFIGGAFTQMSGVQRYSLGAVDPETGNLDAAFEPLSTPFNGSVAGIVIDSDYIYVGGLFTSMLGQPVIDMALLQYTELAPPVPPPPPAPAGNSLTVLKWFPVTRDENNNPISVDGYNVYRSVDPNTEEMVLVATIQTRDINGQVDTMFSERIDGFYRYAVAAFNSFGEGPKSSISAVATTQPERIG